MQLITMMCALICGSVLAACAQSKTNLNTTSSQSSLSSKVSIKRLADHTIEPVVKSVDKATSSANAVIPVVDPQFTVKTTIIDSIVWQIQAGSVLPKLSNPVVPEGQDPSLTKDALEAAFALLSSQVKSPAKEAEFLLQKKTENQLRIGLLAPLSGKHGRLGSDIRRGAEMALFKMAKDNVEILFLDTGGGERSLSAALTGAKNDVDIFIGPLFTNSVIAARSVASQHQIPMLLLSNNSAIVSPGSWLMGYLPEQQLDRLLGYAVTSGKTRFGIVAENAAFGQRLLTHATSRLRDFGLEPKGVRVLTDAELADETRLKDAIRKFTSYKLSETEMPLSDSPFDAVIFAGGPSFALRTAPLLAYYDVGPDRALYLGNSLWNQPQLLREPSLQGGVFSTRPSQFDEKFIASWQTVWLQTPGELSRLGFDALALVLAFSDTIKTELTAEEWSKKLVTNSGFQGYSGAFRLLPDGSNVRAYELRRIQNGQSKIIKSAPDKI